MSKILILANNDIGLYKFRKELIEELLKDNKIYISLPDGEFIPILRDLGCEYIDTPISRRGTNPFTDLKLFIKYIRILKKIKPDIVLTYTIKPNVYGGLACRLYRVPCLANITGLGTAVENRGLMQKITLLLYRISLKKARCVFFQNNDNLQFFKNHKIIRGKYKLIPGSGVNLDYYQYMEYPSDDIIRFVFISRVMKEKGIDQYLEAAEFIKAEYPNTEFHILGFCEEAYEDRLKILQDKGIIIYHGLQKDVRDFHKISHCTIHPSYYPEGMSNVLLESAACGRPIITTNRSGCKEIVDDGVNGYLIEMQNTQNLIRKIEQFILLSYQDKKALSLASRRKVEIDFNRKIVVELYISMIQELIGRKILSD